MKTFILFTRNNDFFLYNYRQGIIIQVSEAIYNDLQTAKKLRILSIKNKTYRDFLFSGLLQGKRIRKRFAQDFVYLSFAPAYSCNLNCKYCFGEAGSSYTGHPRFFTKETAAKVVKYFTETLFPEKKKYRIDFVSGGEPLLGFEIIQSTIELAKEITQKTGKTIKIWVCTNGTLLTKEINHFFSDNGISIGISLDGDKLQNDKNRVTKDGTGSYDSVVRNIKQIQEDSSLSRRYKDIWISCVATNDNHNFVKLLEHFAFLGIKNLQIRLVRDSKTYNVKSIKEEYQKLSDYLLHEFENGNTEKLLMILNDNDQYGKVLKRIITNDICVYRCGAGKNKFTICPNGEIYPCDSLVESEGMLRGTMKTAHSVGKIIWNGNKDVSLREKCAFCEYRFLCGGDCYYHEIKRKNNIEDFCEIQKHIINECAFLRFSLEKVNPELYNELQRKVEIRDEYRSQMG